MMGILIFMIKCEKVFGKKLKNLNCYFLSYGIYFIDYGKVIKCKIVILK